eukprot:TRINITY_DN434_c1_g2_i3.p1 TRINITY_DN434_c1_g2~~TRINITY_DN434_c1_g2_i3.p1  ORF type:complete len:457 (+),score=76.96 TRINITY_DN434_c1_g2_i3:48-1373(+)
MAGIAATAAIEHAECCICFDPMCEAPVAVLLDQRDVRVCSHYFHFDCVKEMCPFVTRGYGMEMEVEEGGDATQKCPMCRAPFTSIARMPDPAEDPRNWFRFVDSDNTGFLSFNNVRDVVNAMCMIDQRQLVKLLKENWSTWDRTQSNGITPQELPALLQFVLAHSPRRRDAQGRTQRQTAPSIVENKEAWFDYWDEDRSGALDRGETARALVKTFEKGTISPQQIREIQSTLENVWAVFDVNRSNTITRAEFLMSDGLADSIIAFLQSQSLRPQPRPARQAAPFAIHSRDLVANRNLGVPETRQRALSQGDRRTNARANIAQGQRPPAMNPNYNPSSHSVPPPPPQTPEAGNRQGYHANPQQQQQAAPQHLAAAHPAHQQGSRTPPAPGHLQPPQQHHQFHFPCVVCCRFTSTGLHRSAGWKCMSCVGKPSRGPHGGTLLI